MIQAYPHNNSNTDLPVLLVLLTSTYRSLPDIMDLLTNVSVTNSFLSAYARSKNLTDLNCVLRFYIKFSFKVQLDLLHDTLHQK
jgi:hypothetical protein